jgi:3-deoxy-D-manno-octulosonic acid (KDO) 8-phosphate synthase
VLVEVHSDPERALCDGPQALTLEMFAQLMGQLRPVVHACGRTMADETHGKLRGAAVGAP